MNHQRESVISFGFLTTLCLLLYSGIGISACDFCFLGGSGGDYDPPQLSYAITLVHDTASPLSDAQIASYSSVGNTGRVFRSYSFSSNSNHLISFDKDGRRFFIDNNLFDTEEQRNPVVLDDSLSSCAFMRDSAEAVCVLNRPGMLANRFNGGADEVQASQVALSFWLDFESTPRVVLADSARFISENRYVVRNFINPVSSSGGNAIAMIRSTETREIVRNAQGEVVDDFVFFAQYDLVLWHNEAPDEVVLLVEDIEIDATIRHQIAIAPDGSRVAYTVRSDGIYVWDAQTSESTKTIDRGRFPRFVSSGDYLIGYRWISSAHEAQIINLDAGTIRTTLPLFNAFSLAVDRETDTVYFIQARSQLSAYSIESGELNVIFNSEQFSEFVESEPEQSPDTQQSVTLNSMFLVSPAAGNQLVVIQDATIYTYSTDDGC